jgi:hypothetical protein
MLATGLPNGEAYSRDNGIGFGSSGGTSANAASTAVRSRVWAIVKRIARKDGLAATTLPS